MPADKDGVLRVEIGNGDPPTVFVEAENKYGATLQTRLSVERDRYGWRIVGWSEASSMLDVLFPATARVAKESEDA